MDFCLSIGAQAYEADSIVYPFLRPLQANQNNDAEKINWTTHVHWLLQTHIAI